MPDFQVPYQLPVVEFTVPEREPVEFSISFHADIQPGTLEVLPPGTDPYIVNVGTERNQIWNFGIPRGETGENASIIIRRL